MRTFEERLERMRGGVLAGRFAGGCRLGLCGEAGVTVAGRTFVPDDDTAYVEFYLAHAWPAVLGSQKTAMMEAVVRNSSGTLQNKVFNFAHLMRAYDPESNPRDRILGTVVGVEMARNRAMSGTCTSDAEPEGVEVPCVRGVAVMHKAAEGVRQILETWQQRRNLFNDERWTVSMENRHNLWECGFLVRMADGKSQMADGKGQMADGQSQMAEGVPEGWEYIPYMDADRELKGCLNTPEEDEKEGTSNTRVKRDYQGREVVLLIGGLDGVVRFNGVGLVPAGREPSAMVSSMVCGAAVAPEDEAVAGVLRALGEICSKMKNEE